MKKIIVTSLTLLALSASLFAQSPVVPQPPVQPYTPSDANMQSREWFKNAKFGMFVHWGLFSLLGDGEWVMNNKNIKIGDIKSLESTTRGKVLKDSFSERGKRLCVSATLVEIQVDRSAGFSAYHAGLVNNYTDVTRVLAVGSTGDLVADSSATFCGVVVGKVGFTNASGGTTNAPYLVGMFDLPENR